MPAIAIAVALFAGFFGNAVLGLARCDEPEHGSAVSSFCGGGGSVAIWLAPLVPVLLATVYRLLRRSDPTIVLLALVFGLVVEAVIGAYASELSTTVGG